MDKLMIAGLIGSGVANLVLFFLWRADYKQALAAKFWKNNFMALREKVTEYKRTIARKEKEIRVLEAEIAQDYDDQRLADALNDATKLPPNGVR